MGSLTVSERVLVGFAVTLSLAILLTPSDLFSSLFGSQSVCPLGYGGGAPFAPLALFSTAPPQPDPRRAVLYFNCSVITSDPSNPRASAFKVRGGRFTFVGTGAETLLTSDDAPTDTVDLQGATVTPGLIDPHVHVISAGLSLSRLDLRSIKSKAEFVERVAKAAAKLTPGQWVLGANWDESAWGGEAPAASWLDAVTPHNPVFLTRSDSHQGVANSLALAAAGLGKATADVAGGVIHRDASGHPTGLLADAAMTLVTSHIPSVGKKERQAALQAAQRHALARGVTAVHDMGRVAFQEGQDAAWEDLMEVYVPAAADGTLKLRVRAFVPLTTWRRMAALVDTVGMEHPGGRLSWGGVKEFFDGSLGSRTALMHAPYEDDSNTSGTLALDLKAFRKDLEGADASGLQVAVHAIGDKAVDAVLDAYDALLAKRKRAALSKDEHKLGRGIDGRRHRIEHAQHLSGPDVPHRLAALGVVVTPNPLHRPSDAAILKPRLGAERCRWAYPFKSLLASGVRCAFATDWPVVPLEPLGTLGAAVGAVGEGDAPLQEELVTPEEGLRGMTRDAAYAGFQEGSIGMMRAGMKADFVIWDGDVLEAARHGLGRPKVVATFVDGVREYGEELAQGTGVKDEL